MLQQINYLESDVALQVLIVEKNTADFPIIHHHLQKAFNGVNVVYCQTLAKAAALAGSNRFDVLLLSIDLQILFDAAAFSGLTENTQAPVIVVCDYPDEKILAELIQLGAQDCLPKEGLNSRILYRSITFAIQRNEYKLLEIHSLKDFKYLFDRYPLPVFVYRVDNDRVRLSNAAAQLFYGFSVDEFKQLSAAQILKTSADNKTISGLQQHQKSNGGYAEVEVLTRLVKIGKKTCRIVTVIELSNKRAPVVLNEDQQQLLLLQAAIKESADGVIITQNNAGNDFEQSDIVYYNVAFTQLTGLHSSEIINRKPADFQQKHPVKEASKTVFGTDVFETRLSNTTQKAAGRWVHYSIRPVEDQAGQVTHFVAVYRDVTACKNSLAESGQALRDLQASNTELKQFAYVISHNLRAPIANLTGLLGLLDTELIKDEDTLEVIDAIKSSTNNLHVSVNDIIDILLIKNDEENVGERLNAYSIWQKTKVAVAQLK